MFIGAFLGFLGHLGFYLFGRWKL
jgi:hypothetical protein